MSHNSIPADATIAVIKGRLRDPIEYVRRVLMNMQSCKEEHGDAVVRIGITGEGVAPHYRIEPEEGLGAPVGRELSSHTSDEMERERTYILRAFYNAYNGFSHKKQIRWSHKELQDDSWSRHSMILAEVRDLIGEMRGYKQRGK